MQPSQSPFLEKKLEQRESWSQGFIANLSEHSRERGEINQVNFLEDCRDPKLFYDSCLYNCCTVKKLRNMMHNVQYCTKKCTMHAILCCVDTKCIHTGFLYFFFHDDARCTHTQKFLLLRELRVF